MVQTTTHDALVQNPDEAISSDVDKDDLERRFIRSKMPCNISTFNVRMLNHITKIWLSCRYQARQLNINVICLQEHRIHHSEFLMQERIGAYLLVTASAEKNTINATVRGVGFLQSSRAQKTCHEINKISERIVVLTLLGNNCYLLLYPKGQRSKVSLLSHIGKIGLQPGKKAKKRLQEHTTDSAVHRLDSNSKWQDRTLWAD